MIILVNMLKYIGKIFLKYYLGLITKIVLVVHRPIIIAVAGSINKAFVKEEVKKALEERKYSVRANPKNFNTEIGLPLAVLSLPSGYNSFRDWIPAILKAPRKIFLRRFPKYLVLSIGTSDPGDASYLLKIIKPKILILTEISQRYLESFKDMDELAKEYEMMRDILTEDDLIIANFDNSRIREILVESKARVLGFGFFEKSDFKLIKIEKQYAGQSFVYEYKNNQINKNIKRFGKHHVYASLVKEAIIKYVEKKL
ncbi:hypothetical protein C0583_01710 [Candidatus Parcubacteria bacterium]|nr:MAG: hypothetical protein C0583_01710 [Candidatus Parcubacteria bacterium]